MSAWTGVDRGLDATNRVVGAMSVRLTDLSEDVADIQRRLPPSAGPAPTPPEVAARGRW
ncbi:hypothetical protein [Streptomyces xanthochromogenes]|uniref:hypothetical protein n=1 Tax=Streptomyces xanthochromogenes TaxID=67384 RepID=UPI002F40C3CC